MRKNLDNKPLALFSKQEGTYIFRAFNSQAGEHHFGVYHASQRLLQDRPTDYILIEPEDLTLDKIGTQLRRLGYSNINQVAEIRVLKGKQGLTDSVDVPCAGCGVMDSEPMIMCGLCGAGFHYKPGFDTAGGFCCEDIGRACK